MIRCSDMMGTRGFVTIATGGEIYYKLARNLLCSYRFHNPDGLPFAIICDEENKFTSGFDDVVLMDNPSFSPVDKLRLTDLAPYDETIFIDSDCLVYRNLDGLWDIFKNSPDFGVLGSLYPFGSSEAWFTKEDAGPFQDKVSSSLAYQGGILFVRKKGLEEFSAICQYINNHYSDFSFNGYPVPGILTDDTIIALACSVCGFNPVTEWHKVFCYFPESDIKRMNIKTGDLKYLWRVKDICLGEDCYLVHFGTRFIDKWLYRREAYRVRCFAVGRRPLISVLIAIKIFTWFEGLIRRVRPIILRIVPLKVKTFFYRVIHGSQ